MHRIGKSIPPATQAARYIPVYMRRKVLEALNELEIQDITERVDAPIPEFLPVVVIPKKDGRVCLCDDMLISNKVIKRTRHPSPAIGKLIHLMSGATAFLNLVVKSGYHQLALAP